MAIGIIDSGLGGLSIWRQLKEQLPHESLYYYGDGKNCPYGNRPASEVFGFVDTGVELLMAEGIKMLVVACNTATAIAIDHLRQMYDLPIVGMEPAVKPAATTTRSGVVAILATAATLGSEQFSNLTARYSDRATIISAVGEGFVEIVESGNFESPEAIEAVSGVLEPLLEAGADRIVLGCTHYPFLKRAMASVIGTRQVQIIDPSPAIEKRVEALLDQNNIRASSTDVAQYRFFTAADEAYIQKMKRLAGV